MKSIYCANCGMQLPLFRKALPHYMRIIDMVEPHICLDEPVEFDLTPVDIPTMTIGEDNMFVQKLNELPIPSGRGGDLRSKEHVRDEIKSTAPGGVLGLVQTEDSKADDPRTIPSRIGSGEPDE